MIARLGRWADLVPAFRLTGWSGIVLILAGALLYGRGSSGWVTAIAGILVVFLGTMLVRYDAAQQVRAQGKAMLADLSGSEGLEATSTHAVDGVRVTVYRFLDPETVQPYVIVDTDTEDTSPPVRAYINDWQVYP